MELIAQADYWLIVVTVTRAVQWLRGAQCSRTAFVQAACTQVMLAQWAPQQPSANPARREIGSQKGHRGNKRKEARLSHGRNSGSVHVLGVVQRRRLARHANSSRLVHDGR
jgi:hypothetical protein